MARLGTTPRCEGADQMQPRSRIIRPLANPRDALTVASNWLPAPVELGLNENDVHVWRAFLDCDRAALGNSEASLASDERARASRFVFARDRDRFIRGRGVLRAILSHYTNRPADTLEFRYEPEGKPRLDLLDSDRPIRFNLAHSRHLAVYAVSRNREIGIDVEAVRSDFIGEELAERYFSPSEMVELRSLRPDQRQEGFFLCWTRKEAYVKALGAGLAIPLDSFDVSLTPERPATLVSTDSARWKLHSFQPAAGYAGAVVAEGQDWRISLWDFDPRDAIAP